jgi:hypothetical protein
MQIRMVNLNIDSRQRAHGYNVNQKETICTCIKHFLKMTSKLVTERVYVYHKKKNQKCNEILNVVCNKSFKMFIKKTPLQWWIQNKIKGWPIR